MKLLFLLLLLTGCAERSYDTVTIYEVRPEIIKECQNILNEEKKVNYNHCRDLVYFKCGYVKFGTLKSLKMFKILKNANKYCESLRNNAEPKN